MNKISYALGLGIGQQLKSMGIEDFNVQDFTQSICDVLTDAEMSEIIGICIDACKRGEIDDTERMLKERLGRQ